MVDETQRQCSAVKVIGWELLFCTVSYMVASPNCDSAESINAAMAVMALMNSLAVVSTFAQAIEVSNRDYSWGTRSDNDCCHACFCWPSVPTVDKLCCEDTEKRLDDVDQKLKEQNQPQSAVRMDPSKNPVQYGSNGATSPLLKQSLFSQGSECRSEGQADKLLKPNY